mgnify:CR=1
MPYDISHLAKGSSKQSKRDVWAESPIKYFLVTFASFGKSYSPSRAEKSSLLKVFEWNLHN